MLMQSFEKGEKLLKLKTCGTSPATYARNPKITTKKFQNRMHM